MKRHGTEISVGNNSKMTRWVATIQLGTKISLMGVDEGIMLRILKVTHSVRLDVGAMGIRSGMGDNACKKNHRPNGGITGENSMVSLPIEIFEDNSIGKILHVAITADGIRIGVDNMWIWEVTGSMGGNPGLEVRDLIFPSMMENLTQLCGYQGLIVFSVQI